MSTFLNLCQAARREFGIQGTGPSTVTGQTGILNKVVYWVMEADYRIQSKWHNWNFLWSQWSGTSTSADDPTYDAPATLGTWDEDSFYLDYLTANYKHLRVMDYWIWRDTMRQGVKTSNKPDRVIILPDKSIILEPPPDDTYAITADYWKTPTKFSTDGQLSAIPVRHEWIIIMRAKMLYAADEEAWDVYNESAAIYKDLLNKLESAELPDQKNRLMSRASGMRVCPE